MYIDLPRTRDACHVQEQFIPHNNEYINDDIIDVCSDKIENIFGAIESSSNITNTIALQEHAEMELAD